MIACCDQGHEMRPGRDVLDPKGRVTVEAVWICRTCQASIHVRSGPDGRVITKKPLRQLQLPEDE